MVEKIGKKNKELKIELDKVISISKEVQNTQPLAVTNSQPSALQYDQSQVIPQQAVSPEPVCTEYFCMVCMVYFSTFRKSEKHMERFHDELSKRIGELNEKD